MKVQSIASTTFQGIYKEILGSKKLEYKPYSWERNSQDMFGAATFTKINLQGTVLPDNTDLQTIFNPNAQEKEILTTSAMDRETSLIEKNKKWNTFLERKLEARQQLENKMTIQQKVIAAANYTYNNTQDSNKKDFAQALASDNSQQHFNILKKYISLRDSIESIKDTRNSELLEIEKLKNARENGQLIDISRRDIKNPDKSLIDEIAKMIKTNTLNQSKKLIALPHKTITVQEVLKSLAAMGKDNNISQNFVKYIGYVIKNGV